MDPVVSSFGVPSELNSTPGASSFMISFGGCPHSCTLMIVRQQGVSFCDLKSCFILAYLLKGRYNGIKVIWLILK